MGRAARWDERCSDILRLNAQHYTNSEMAAVIEAETGKRFQIKTVSDHRAALGLDSPRRNDWTSPLRKWRPWQ